MPKLNQSNGNPGVRNALRQAFVRRTETLKGKAWRVRYHAYLDKMDKAHNNTHMWRPGMRQLLIHTGGSYKGFIHSSEVMFLTTLQI